MKTSGNRKMKIYIILIFSLMVAFLSCRSSKTSVSGSSIPVSDKYYYVILYEKSKFQIENATIIDGILSGKLSGEEVRKIGNKLTLYLSSDTSLIISSAEILSVPVSDVSRIEIVEYSPGKTILLVLGTILGVVVFIGALNFQIDTF